VQAFKLGALSGAGMPMKLTDTSIRDLTLPEGVADRIFFDEDSPALD
jgi:hypothetical protein